MSEFTRNRLIDRLNVNPERIALIRDGIDEKFLKYQRDEMREKEMRERYHLPECFILSLSTLEPRKNLRLLVEAYQSMVLRGEICEDLVLVGRKGWKIDDLLKGIAPEVQRRIHFTGFVSDDDIPSIYSMAKVFVFPSKYEGFGLPPLEAMACGTPVISSDAASLPEVLGSAAVYFRSESREDLEDAMFRFLRMEGEALKQMRAAGRKRAAMFCWSTEAQKLEVLLRRIKEEAE